MEIKFRGISKENNKMVFGFYHQDPEDGHFITDFEYVNVSGSFDEPPSGYFKKVMIEVIPETIGQFTGLTDRYKKKIYEGDVVRRIAEMRNYCEGDGTTTGIHEVKYHGIELLPFSETGIDMTEYEVIGSIHENPELVDDEQIIKTQ